MFPSRYFANRYFAPRFWPKVGATAAALVAKIFPALHGPDNRFRELHGPDSRFHELDG